MTFLFFSLVGLFTTAKATQELGTQSLSLDPTSRFTDLLFPPNQNSPSNEPINNTLTVHCDGEEYGFGPIISDCQNAIDFIVPDMTQIAFADRHSGWGEEVFPLPYRVMGSMFWNIYVNNR